MSLITALATLSDVKLGPDFSMAFDSLYLGAFPQGNKIFGMGDDMIKVYFWLSTKFEFEQFRGRR